MKVFLIRSAIFLSLALVTVVAVFIFVQYVLIKSPEIPPFAVVSVDERIVEFTLSE